MGLLDGADHAVVALVGAETDRGLARCPRERIRNDGDALRANVPNLAELSCSLIRAVTPAELKFMRKRYALEERRPVAGSSRLGISPFRSSGRGGRGSRVVICRLRALARRLRFLILFAPLALEALPGRSKGSSELFFAPRRERISVERAENAQPPVVDQPPHPGTAQCVTNQ